MGLLFIQINLHFTDRYYASLVEIALLAAEKDHFQSHQFKTYFHYFANISLENMINKTQWGFSCSKFGCYWPSGSEEDEIINI